MGGVLNKIGDYNKRVEIQAKTTVTDGMGGTTVTWVTLATVYAKITPVSSSERLEAMKNGNEITHRVNIRFRSVFKSAYRIKYGNRYFSIVGVMNVLEKGEELQMTCKEAA